MIIREATPSDLALATQIVRSSSAYKGMYQAQVEQVEFSNEYLAHSIFRVAEDAASLIGFYALRWSAESPSSTEIELDFLFVENSHQGRGVGKALLADAQAQARAQGASTLLIIAHPPSASFYQKMGANYEGVSPPTGQATWPRPVYRIYL